MYRIVENLQPLFLAIKLSSLVHSRKGLRQRKHILELTAATALTGVVFETFSSLQDCNIRLHFKLQPQSRKPRVSVSHKSARESPAWRQQSLPRGSQAQSGRYPETAQRPWECR